MKKIVAILLVLAMAVACCACGGSTAQAPAASTPAASSSTAAPAASAPAAPANPQVTLKWSCSESEDSVFGMAMKAAFEEVTEKTNGDVTFEYYYSNALGTIPEFMEQMLSGSPIICSGGIDTASEYCNSIMPAAFPYTYKDINEIFALQKSTWWEDAKAAMAGEHIAPVALGASGYRHFVGSLKVEKADDLKGHIVRMGPASMAQTFMSVIGASPTTTTWSDNYSLIQNGGIELCEASVDLLWSSSLQEVSDYLNLSGHFITPFVIMMNDACFSSLGEEYQAILCDAVDAQCQTMVDKALAAQDEYVQKFKDYGVEVVETDKDSFAPYLPKLYDALGFDTAEYDKLRAAIEAAK